MPEDSSAPEVTHVTAPEDKVPVVQKVAYGLGTTSMLMAAPLRRAYQSVPVVRLG